MRSVLGKVWNVFPSALLIVSLVFFLTPATIYIGNVHEFSASLVSIWSALLLPALLLLVILLLAASVLPKKIYWIYQLGVLLVAILMWLQANYLVWNYGSFNGQQIDWNKNLPFGYLELAIWIFAFAAGYRYREVLLKKSAKICYGIFGIQIITVVFSAMTTLSAAEQKQKAEIDKPVNSSYAFSKTGNVIHIVLDSVQSDIMQEILTEQNQNYAQKFEGFTFFTNATSSFSATQMSVPSFLTNHVYENQKTMKEFLDEVFNGKNIINILSDRGYVTDVFHAAYPFPRGKASSYQIIKNPYRGIKSQNFDGLKMINYSLFRLLPHTMKRRLYNNQNWRFYDYFENVEERKEYFIYNNFLSDLANNMYVSNEKPTYKYIHSLSTHMPIEINKDCKFAGVQPTTRENAKNLFRCGLIGVLQLFDSLKKNGIYDSAIIVLHSDHGFGVTVSEMKGMDSKGIDPFKGRTVDEEYHGDIVQGVLAGRANPFVMIKPAESKGDLKFSQAPIELLDISPTILDLLKIDEVVQGTSVYKIKETAERRRLFKYFFDSSKAYLGQLDEYVIEGNVRNRGSWKLGRKLGVDEKL